MTLLAACRECLRTEQIWCVEGWAMNARYGQASGCHSSRCASPLVPGIGRDPCIAFEPNFEMALIVCGMTSTLLMTIAVVLNHSPENECASRFLSFAWSCGLGMFVLFTFDNLVQGFGIGPPTYHFEAPFPATDILQVAYVLASYVSINVFTGVAVFNARSHKTATLSACALTFAFDFCASIVLSATNSNNDEVWATGQKYFAELAVGLPLGFALFLGLYSIMLVFGQEQSVLASRTTQGRSDRRRRQYRPVQVTNGTALELVEQRENDNAQAQVLRVVQQELQKLKAEVEALRRRNEPVAAEIVHFDEGGERESAPVVPGQLL